MMKPKKHNQRLSSSYVPPKVRKDCVQRPLFEEEDAEEPKVTQPEPIEPEPAPEPIIIDKKDDEIKTVGTIPLKEIGTMPLETNTTVPLKTDTTTPLEEASVVEPPVTDKTEACQQCKEPIMYRSDDLHPGIVCSKCGHGQNNPNLKGKMW